MSEITQQMEKYEKETEEYREKKEVIDLFKQYKKPKEIAEETCYSLMFVNMTIDEYTHNGYKYPDAPQKPKRELKIPIIDGSIWTMDLNDFEIHPNDVKHIFKSFIDPEGDYKFDPEFTAEWFRDAFDYEADVNETCI